MEEYLQTGVTGFHLKVSFMMAVMYGRFSLSSNVGTRPPQTLFVCQLDAIITGEGSNVPVDLLLGLLLHLGVAEESKEEGLKSRDGGVGSGNVKLRRDLLDDALLVLEILSGVHVVEAVRDERSLVSSSGLLLLC